MFSISAGTVVMNSIADGDVEEVRSQTDLQDFPTREAAIARAGEIAQCLGLTETNGDDWFWDAQRHRGVVSAIWVEEA